jgi:hypothetical protein
MHPTRIKNILINLTSFMGTPNSMRILYKAYLLKELHGPYGKLKMEVAETQQGNLTSLYLFLQKLKWMNRHTEVQTSFTMPYKYEPFRAHLKGNAQRETAQYPPSVFFSDKGK